MLQIFITGFWNRHQNTAVFVFSVIDKDNKTNFLAGHNSAILPNVGHCLLIWKFCHHLCLKTFHKSGFPVAFAPRSRNDFAGKFDSCRSNPYRTFHNPLSAPPCASPSRLSIVVCNAPPVTTVSMASPDSGC